MKEHEDQYQTERRIASEIMETVMRLGLPFKLDEPTEGLLPCCNQSTTPKARDIQ